MSLEDALLDIDPDNPPEYIAIRTSDRAAYRRCRRKWGMSSALRGNLGPNEKKSYFWLGTGGHFALEDYHGYNVYGHPCEAFLAYVHAYRLWCARSDVADELPPDYEEQTEMALAILEYYLQWLESRDPLHTYWVDGQPQVEVRVQIPLPISYELDNGHQIPIRYDMTFDRVIIDVDGLYGPAGALWIQDWKFMKNISEGHYDTDGQISAYCWGGNVLYDSPIEGFIYHQFRKTFPKGPRVLQSGEISTAQNQLTSHRLYREALVAAYGDIARAPAKNIDFMNMLAQQESAHRDAFIQRDLIHRSVRRQQATGEQILAEATEMLNPELPLYPNPTKDCAWDCWMNDICVMMDSGEDWEHVIKLVASQQSEVRDGWREHLPQGKKDPVVVPPTQTHLEVEEN